MLPSTAKVLSPERQTVHIPRKGTLFQLYIEVMNCGMPWEMNF